MTRRVMHFDWNRKGGIGGRLDERLAGEGRGDEHACDDPTVFDGVDHRVGLADAVRRHLRVERGELEPRPVAHAERRLLLTPLHVGREGDESFGHDLAAAVGVLAVLQGHDERELVHALRRFHRRHFSGERRRVTDGRVHGRHEVEEGQRLLRGEDRGGEVQGDAHDLERLPRPVQAGAHESVELEAVAPAERESRRPGLLCPVRRDPVSVLLRMANDDDRLLSHLYLLHPLH